MRSFYQPRRGGSIEVVSEKAASEILVDFNEKPESADREEEFINEYIQQNAKRIQSASSSTTIASSILSSDDDLIEQKETKTTPRRLSRHASARQLFQVNEWDEQQKRMKEKSRQENRLAIILTTKSKLLPKNF